MKYTHKQAILSRASRHALAWAVVAVALLFGAPAGATPPDYEGKLRAAENAPVPENGAIEIQPVEPRERNPLVETLLTESLKGHGYDVQVEAPLVLRYRAAGVLTQVKDNTSWVQLQSSGAGGSSSGGAGLLSMTLSNPGSDDKDKPRVYQLELRVERRDGQILWEAYGVVDSKSSDIGHAARGMVNATVDRIGRNYYGPLLR
ncbi:MAG: hypothetical protein NTY59_05640 [Alphaproteobacteria bacterium]|nr:hypothetical protein [Alphaproteobacteria bacterium]